MPIAEFKREDKTAVSNASGTTRREKNLAVRSSPEARRAHLEIDAYREPTDDWHALFEMPADRTRAEHATFLNGVSQEARDLYERGATIYGDTLIIPRETVDTTHPTNQIRIGSLTFAVRQFTPLVGEEKAKDKALEFVGLGRDIAGRTADGDTLLTVFREFYNEVKKDEQGRLLSHTEQIAKLDRVLAGMRGLAAAIREQQQALITARIGEANVEQGWWNFGTEAAGAVSIGAATGGVGTGTGQSLGSLAARPGALMTESNNVEIQARGSIGTSSEYLARTARSNDSYAEARQDVETTRASQTEAALGAQYKAQSGAINTWNAQVNNAADVQAQMAGKAATESTGMLNEAAQTKLGGAESSIETVRAAGLQAAEWHRMAQMIEKKAAGGQLRCGREASAC